MFPCSVACCSSDALSNIFQRYSEQKKTEKKNTGYHSVTCQPFLFQARHKGVQKKYICNLDTRRKWVVSDHDLSASHPREKSIYIYIVRKLKPAPVYLYQTFYPQNTFNFYLHVTYTVSRRGVKVQG